MSAPSKIIKMSVYILGNPGHIPENPGQSKVENLLCDHVMSHRDEISEAEYLDYVKCFCLNMDLLNMLRSI